PTGRMRQAVAGVFGKNTPAQEQSRLGTSVNIPAQASTVSLPTTEMIQVETPAGESALQGPTVKHPLKERKEGGKVEDTPAKLVQEIQEWEKKVRKMAQDYEHTFDQSEA